VADEALSLARLTGDCVIAAYFSSAKHKERETNLGKLEQQLVKYIGPQGRIEDRQLLTQAVATLHSGGHAIQPFHWQIEFPEVFTIDGNKKPACGFDAIVGNPPFLGGKRISGALGKEYSQWLCMANVETNGNADLVAHFFRRAFNCLRIDGAFALIATNTISQGDTRRGGLRFIGKNGGEIYFAQKRLQWPGVAAVIVSVIGVYKGVTSPTRCLNGKAVGNITAFLVHTGSHDDPATLATNLGIAFIGCDIKGQGFLFDDDDEEASPTSQMQSLITLDSGYKEIIRPYMSGEEILDDPKHVYKRWVIHFGEMELDEAARWPLALQIVREKVQSERQTKAKELAEWPWWRFWRTRRELYGAISGLDRMLVLSRVGDRLLFAFIGTDIVVSETVVVFASSSQSFFATVQSRVHEVWTRLLASSLKDDVRYTPTDCFETFPFPAGALEHAAGDSPTMDDHTRSKLETAGREYYEFRAALMVRHNEGLTDAYNRFHDPYERSPDILKLRDLHAAMDLAVLESYGWHDLAKIATYDYLLDYEDDDDEDDGSAAASPSRRQKKKPWRYRWPDDFRDEVLARLLELNKQRAEQERLTGDAASATGTKTAKPAKTKAKKSKTGTEGTGNLFDLKQARGER
jgi:hypothetical protein